MARVVKVHAYGGPEALQVEDADPGRPAKGEALIRQSAIGLNFIDVYHRTGLYPQPSMPFTPGMEGAGVVEAVGEGVSDLKPGDRVAYAGTLGGYAEMRRIPADRLVKVPAAIDDKTASEAIRRGLRLAVITGRDEWYVWCFSFACSARLRFDARTVDELHANMMVHKPACGPALMEYWSAQTGQDSDSVLYRRRLDALMRFCRA